MRVAVISDIHANLEALHTVLDAIEREAPDVVWCLGDLVGYGPRPNECCEAVSERASVCLVGNHDLAVLGTVDIAEFNDDAGAAAAWTRAELNEDSRAFLESLQPQGRADRVELFHGSPRDPVWAYVLSAGAAIDAFELSSASTILVGHSHVALAIGLVGATLTGGLAPTDDALDISNGRWLLNPGSVGQPRDGDPRASYLMLDLAERFATFRRVSYSIEKTQREMRARGLPAALATRLEHGQ